MHGVSARTSGVTVRRQLELAASALVAVGVCLFVVATGWAGRASLDSALAAGSCSAGPSSITTNFNGTAVAAGSYIWFNSHMKVTNQPASGSFTVRVDSAVVDPDPVTELPMAQRYFLF